MKKINYPLLFLALLMPLFCKYLCQLSNNMEFFIPFLLFCTGAWYIWDSFKDTPLLNKWLNNDINSILVSILYFGYWLLSYCVYV